MKPYLRPVLALAVLAALTACESEKVKTLKSPCAGAEGSPCGTKRLPAGNASIIIHQA